MGFVESGVYKVFGTDGIYLRVGNVQLCTYKTESALSKECKQIVEAYEQGARVYYIKGESD